MPDFQHKTVLLKETVDGINPEAGKTYLDVTFGGGGHTSEILSRESNCKVIALDWDKNSLKLVSPKFEEKFGKRIQILWGSFADVYKIFKKNKLGKVDGIIADFGTSQHQIFNCPGLSFANKDYLDMRMSKSHSKISAAEVLEHFEQRELERIFSMYGQERFSRKIADKIVYQRKTEKIIYSDQLAELVKKVVLSNTKGTYDKTIHPATKVFQALRIFVNKEIENIEKFINSVFQICNPEAKIACISFHSLEDKAVKKTVQEQEDKARLEFITKKPILPSKEEVENNPSSRSAKLRIFKVL